MFSSGVRFRCLLFWPSSLRARLAAGSPWTRESRRWSGGGDSGGSEPSEPSEHLVCAGRAAGPNQSRGPGAPRLSGVGLGSLRGDRAGDWPLFPTLATLHTSFQPPSQPPSPCAVVLFVFPAPSPPPRLTNSPRGCVSRPRPRPSSGTV